MELEVLKKKLSTFKGGAAGRIRGVSDDLLLEVLAVWETWSGTSKSFYTNIGISAKGMASMLGKAKRLKREGAVMPFSEVLVDGVTNTINSSTVVCDIEVQDQNKVIRFGKVDLLIEYLKKAA